MEVSKETSSKFKVGDKVVNFNSYSWSAMYGVMTVVSVDQNGDIWCMNEAIREHYPFHGICQSSQHLTLASELVKALL